MICFSSSIPLVPTTVEFTQPFLRPVSCHIYMRYLECKSIMYIREDSLKDEEPINYQAEVYPFWTRKKPQLPYIDEKWNLQDEIEKITLFQKLGGRVIIELDEQARECIQIDLLDYEIDGYANTPLYIGKEDRIFPICHDGTNRSQTLYECGCALSRALGLLSTSLPLPPHGVFSGFDPYSHTEPLTMNNYYLYIHEEEV